MSERRRARLGRGLLVAAIAVLGARAALGADSGDVPLQRVHTGDLGMLIAVDVEAGVEAGVESGAGPGEARGRWLVDTGATHHLVSPAFAERYRLPVLGDARAETAFGRFEGRQVELPPLRVGALTLAGQRALVLDLVAVAGTAAAGIDGVLGAPALAAHALDLDLRRWTLRLHDDGAPACPPGHEALPLALHQGLPVVELRVDGAAPERALLDTGNAGALVRIDGLLAPRRTGTAVPGLSAVAARASAVELGPLRRLDVPVTFLRSPTLRRALAADVGALAGMAVLEGARLRLELGRARLGLEAGERRLPGGYGLAIGEDADGWFVSAVYDASPAAQAGLRAGDRLRRWNGGPPPDSVAAAWAAVHGRDELALAVERGAAARAVTLRRAWFLPPL